MKTSSISSVFIAITVVAAWIVFLLSRGADVISSDNDAGLRRTIQGFKKDAAILLKSWPTENGTLPYLGRFSVSADDPDRICAEGAYFDDSIVCRYGIFVARTDDGRLIFDYDLDEKVGKIEYHPNGSKPRPYTDIWRSEQNAIHVRLNLDHFHELEPNWYLVSYDFGGLSRAPSRTK